MTPRAKFFLTIPLVGLFAVVSSVAAEPGPSSRPHLLMILVDDLGYGDLTKQ